jgi:hypothetical protein
MKLRVAAVLVGALVAVAMGEGSTPDPHFALTTIDEVPTKGELELALTDETDPTPPEQKLIAYALGSGGDVGIQLRAIAALTNYGSGADVHSTLTGLIAAYATAHSGSELLILRAAIEADGPLKVQDDLGILAPLLDHPSRDIRAATARTLAMLCNSNAITALQQRYQNESTDQVKLAISAALRTLPCPVN